MKRLFLIFAIVIASVGSLWAAVGFMTQPYLQSMSPTGVTVMWVVSGSSQVHGWVEYGKDSCTVQAFEYTDGLKQAFTKIYRVRLDSLQPATTYHYRAAIREIVGFVGNTSLTWGDTHYSDEFTFTTPAMDDMSVKCLVFNDLHSRPECMDTLMKVNSLSFTNQDFVFLNGDLLNAVPSEDEILTKMLVPYAKDFASTTPFFFTRGNHEYRNKYARHLYEYMDVPSDKTYYAFTWGPCRFIVLDTGEDKADDDKEYNGLIATEAYRQEQVAWLQLQLTSAEYMAAQYHVVFMHIPFYSNTKTARFAVGDCRDKFLKLMNDNHVDVVISGHTHKAGVLEADSTHLFPIVIGGGKDTIPEKLDYCPAVISLQADAAALNIEMFNYYGVQKGSVTITK